MDVQQTRRITSILEAANDMTIATLRPDGWPQATTVSYVSDGLDIYFGCDGGSQKARNITADDRVSVTVNLPYDDWEEIRGLSLAGRAERVEAPDEIARVGALMVQKFPQIAQYVQEGKESPALFRIRPQVVSILDYRQGFGATELVSA